MEENDDNLTSLSKSFQLLKGFNNNEELILKTIKVVLENLESLKKNLNSEVFLKQTQYWLEVESKIKQRFRNKRTW